MNKDRQHYGFTVEQIVYMYNPRGSQLQTGSRKIQCHFVGPLAIYKCVSPNQFLLMSLDGVLYPMIVEEARCKPGLIPIHKGPVRTMSELRNAAKLALTHSCSALVLEIPVRNMHPVFVEILVNLQIYL